MKLAKATALLPSGKNNATLRWMLREIAYRIGDGDKLPTATELAESATYNNGHDEWLDDPDHWVWDAACIALDGQKGTK